MNRFCLIDHFYVNDKSSNGCRIYVDIIIGGKFWSIQLANIELVYWSVRSSSWRGGGRRYVRISAKHRVLTKNVGNGSYFYYVRCATLIVREGGMPWPKTGAKLITMHS